MVNQESPIPRGIEVLVKKAAVDPEFKQILLEKRASAADEIGLKLEAAEIAMLNTVPRAQLETIIANTNVSEVSRAAFLGRAAAVMLAALGVSAAGCSRQEATDGIRPGRPATKGVRPDRPPEKDVPEEKPAPATEKTPATDPKASFGGVRPDRPPAKEEPKPATPPETKTTEPKEQRT